MNDAHLTPAKLLGTDILPTTWEAAKTAFICFTPFPNGFKPYVQEIAKERYFLHSPNAEVRLYRFQDVPFIVISEVYGFPVGATTVEELVHHGINNIIGIGYAGAFGAVTIGQPFIAVDTISDLPLATHYGVHENERCMPTEKLFGMVTECIKEQGQILERFTVWTSNSLYRESPQLIQRMKEKSCDAVNMDVLSIYAVTPVCSRDACREVGCIYVGTVTDSEGDSDEGWDSDLAEDVKGETAHPHDGLVKLMVEKVLHLITAH